MDFTGIANALIGEVGALPGVLILGLAWALWQERRRANSAVDSRIEDQKEHTGQILEAVRSVERAIDAVEGRNGQSLVEVFPAKRATSRHRAAGRDSQAGRDEGAAAPPAFSGRSYRRAKGNSD